MSRHRLSLRSPVLFSPPTAMFKPRDQPGWHKASEWLLASTIAVHGFGSDYYSAHSKVTESEIEEVFRLYGKILHTQIWKSQKGGAWAFVTFTCPEDRDAAISQLDGQTVDVWTREGHNQIQWQTPLQVRAPRYHSVRFYYNQYAAARIVPPELAFTPSAAPGQGGTFQRALARYQRSSLFPPTGPRHGRRQSHNLFIDTSFQNSYDRPSSPALSGAEMSIQWGQERVKTPEPASPAYDSERTFCSSGENVSPGEDDGEEMEEYDFEYEEEHDTQATSLFHQRPPASRDSPSPMPSSQYDDHDDSSVYPQSPRSASEPSSQGRKRRRLDDEFDDDDDPYAMIRRLQADNERLRRERDEALDEADALREEKEIRSREVEAERVAYARRIERLTDNLCAELELEREQGRRPQKRSGVSTPPPLEPRSSEESDASAPLPVTAALANNLVSALQSNEGAALLATMLRQMATANIGQA